MKRKYHPLNEIQFTHLGYKLNHTDKVGWWIDGVCGFIASGYYDTRAEAIKRFNLKRRTALSDSHINMPVWMFEWDFYVYKKSFASSIK